MKKVLLAILAILGGILTFAKDWESPAPVLVNKSEQQQASKGDTTFYVNGKQVVGEVLKALNPFPQDKKAVSDWFDIGEKQASGKYYTKEQAFEYDSLYYCFDIYDWVEPDFTPNFYDHLCQVMFGEHGTSLSEGFETFMQNTGKNYATDLTRKSLMQYGARTSYIELHINEHTPQHFVTGRVNIFNNLLAILPNKLKGSAQTDVNHFFTYDLKHDRLVTPENMFTDPSIVKDRDSLSSFWVEDSILYMNYVYDPANAITYQLADISQYLTQEFKDCYVANKTTAPQKPKAAAIPPSTQGTNGTAIATVVEQMPQFPGGDAALFKYLSTHIIYPAMALENCVQGRVIVTFVIERDGSLSEVKVAKPAAPILDHEAVRVVLSMPKWKPGTLNGKAVRVKHTVPVTFRMF